MANNTHEQGKTEGRNGEDQIRSLDYRGLKLTGRLPTACVSKDDLKKLHLTLSKKTGEAMEKYLSGAVPQPHDSAADVEKLKERLRATGGLTVAIWGTHGEQICITGADSLDSIEWPEKIATMIFDSGISLQSENVSLPNTLKLNLDFTIPSFLSYNPFDQPTPTSSYIEVNGPDSTWVTAVHTETLAFFTRRGKPRKWIHSQWTYSTLSWFVGLPAALWIAVRADTILTSLVPSLHGSIRGAADIYAALIGFLGFRAALHLWRWLYPILELKGVGSGKPRKCLGALLFAVVVGLIVDAITNVF